MLSAKTLASSIDHTLLKPTATREEIKRLCAEACEWEFFSVCVNPYFVSLAKELTQNSTVKVCTVVGFPLGQNTTHVKVLETQEAINLGADEIDMVMNVSALRARDLNFVGTEISHVVEAAMGRAVKLIIETCLLSADEMVLASELGRDNGVKFIKTSTGFSSAGAKEADVKLIRRVVGPHLGVKASGGIKDLAAAENMLSAGANRLGLSSSVSIMKTLKDKL